jgi:hypothetical protein
MALLLRPGFPLDRTIQGLRELEASSTHFSTPDLMRQWQGYLNWTHSVELFFRTYFTGFRLERLYTDRFWHGQSLAASSPYAPGLLNNEHELQVAFLTELREALTREEQRQAELKDVPVAVLDTNVLLHYRLFTDVPWQTVLATDRVRVAVPLRVVDELDLKKAARRSDLASRAATVLKHLQERIAGLTDAPVSLRPGVTLEVARVPQLDADAYIPPVWADAEILDTCEALAIFASSPTTLVTGDYGMKLRASTRNVRTLVMPDEYRNGDQSAA